MLRVGSLAISKSSDCDFVIRKGLPLYQNRLWSNFLGTLLEL